MKLTTLIKESYSKKVVDQLVQKFQKEDPKLSTDMIIQYVNRFDQIKNSPNVQQKDITAYKWKDLETVVDSNQSKRVKAGKVDATAEDANLIYRKNNLRVYIGKDKKACIKYGNGYSFCISARGEDNQYGYYRMDSNGTPYFVFDDSKSTEVVNNKFVDPNHLLVVFVYTDQEWGDDEGELHYTVSDANNEGDKEFSNITHLTNNYPVLKEIAHLFKPSEPSQFEIDSQRLKSRYTNSLGTTFWDAVSKENATGKEGDGGYIMRGFFVYNNADLKAVIDGKKELTNVGYYGENAYDYANQNIFHSTDEELKEKVKTYAEEIARVSKQPINKVLDDIEVDDMTIGIRKYAKKYPNLYPAFDTAQKLTQEYKSNLNKLKLKYQQQ